MQTKNGRSETAPTEGIVHHLHGEIDFLFRDNQVRGYNDTAEPWDDEHSLLHHLPRDLIHDQRFPCELFFFRVERLLRLTVFHQLNSPEQAFSSDIADG